MAPDTIRPSDARRRGSGPPLAARPLRLVVDASVAVPACIAPDGFAALRDHELAAPSLLWSETLAALHQLVWRRELTREDADAAREALAGAPIELRESATLLDDAWHIAGELGWAKTYDAEYVALARVLGCPVLTLDGRLRRSAGRYGVVLPSEL